jgi:hypothetical protein
MSSGSPQIASTIGKRQWGMCVTSHPHLCIERAGSQCHD